MLIFWQSFQRNFEKKKIAGLRGGGDGGDSRLLKSKIYSGPGESGAKPERPSPGQASG